MRGAQVLRLTDFLSVDMNITRIGAGGFGLVYMGPDRLSGGEWCALKTLRPELVALMPELRDVFLTECITWVGLWPHPNLLTASTGCLIDGEVFLLLEYAEQGSLRDVLSTNPPLVWRLRWAQHIAAGLLALHTPDAEFLRPKPLIHRDLKPENILVSATGIAMISDFGLAAVIGKALTEGPGPSDAVALIERLAEEDMSLDADIHSRRITHATRTTRFHVRSHGGSRNNASELAGLGGVGTIAYMAPEQWIEGGEIGTSADMYAFGLILSELLAGRHGLANLDVNLDEDSWYHLHVSAAPRPLRTGIANGAADLPVELEQLYRALLAKRPEERPTAAEALVVLQEAAQQLDDEPYTAFDIIPRVDELRRIRWNAWAATCRKLNLFMQALERSNKALALDPHDFSTLNIHGNIVADLGRQMYAEGLMTEGVLLEEEALNWYSRALAASTTVEDSAITQGIMASLLSQLGRYSEAEILYDAVLAIVPGDGVKWSNRTNNAARWAEQEDGAGRSVEALRVYEMAEKYAQTTLQLRPNHPTIRTLLAFIHQAIARLKT